MTKDQLNECAKMLWAKIEPYHPLWCHLLDTGAVCKRLVQYLRVSEDIPDVWVVFLAAMHDIGKADPKFQAFYDKQPLILRKFGLSLPLHQERFRHEARSGDWIYNHLISKYNWGKHSARVAMSALWGHHGNFNSHLSDDESFQSDDWNQLRSRLANIVADVLKLEEQAFSPSGFVDYSRIGVMLVGLTVLSDWIASNAELYRFADLDTNLKPDEYWQQACSEAVRAVDVLQLSPLDNSSKSADIPSFSDIWHGFDDLKPSQSALEKACKEGFPPGLAIIEAPMGEGKTESAIYLAECWRRQCGAIGTYIALPTMATSNQMYRRYSEFLSRHHSDEVQPRLVHGMAWLVDDIAPQEGSMTYGEDASDEKLLAREWFSPSKRALLAPEGVGTIDQALMGALNVKHGFLRLLGLSSKVLIIDEVHAYDEYMTVILERLLKWCHTLRIPVILLSATLSQRQKRRLMSAYESKLPEELASDDSYPLITLVPMEGESGARCTRVDSQHSRTIRVTQHTGMLDNARETALLAIDSINDGGCACVLINTVAQAQAVYKELDRMNSDAERYLFHARFPAFRRAEIEDKVVSLFGKEAAMNGKRPKKAVMVATQVVEQSMDLDFDVMVSQLAPIDLLLQRIGRLWRHRNLKTPRYGLEETLHILMPDTSKKALGGSKYVYGEAALKRTIAVLENRDHFSLPDDFRPMIDACYSDEYVFNSIVSEREQMLADIEREHKHDSDANKAYQCLIPPPSATEFSLATNAFDPREESDEATKSYLMASPRLEGRTHPALILENPALIDAARRSTPPKREMLKELFLHKVDIPLSWLKNLEPADGFDEITEGAKWLRRAIVIPMRSDKWKGLQDGKPFEITYDYFMGVEKAEAN